MRLISPRRFAAAFLVMLFGCASAQAVETEYNLGVQAYREKNYAAARAHWLMAVEQGETSALNNLGFLLYNGLGGEPDPARAVALWRKAAVVGHSESQWHLAQALEAGKGEAPSPVEAYAWYRCAATQFADVPRDDAENEIGHDARESVIRILGKLALDQLSPAEQLAREFIAKNPAKTDSR
ncbi:tetratricopeptide repeat protein [Massilia sp. R2A-15]|uniref:tetratricopeptide repeat protein n=1 Tax=Massilia sp. R2A-15 TaxID=3064278 RepID=UPI002736A19C|nr:tetratricopeptide repeat protein [Massilia sp. R2A-15]WLI89665.1 tetratricopeptide repeat protein [Massilia sp. R2A-15]